MDSVGSAPALSKYITGLAQSISLNTDSTFNARTQGQSRRLSYHVRKNSCV